MALLMTKEITERVEFVLPMIREKFSQKKIPIALGLAIAMKESSMNYNVKPVMSAWDGKRGGSYGLFMMSFRTARDLGFTGSAEQLSQVKKNISMAAKLIDQDMRRFKRFLPDVISAYNCGDGINNAPQSTRDFYVPKVLEYYEDFQRYLNNR